MTGTHESLQAEDQWCEKYSVTFGIRWKWCLANLCIVVWHAISNVTIVAAGEENATVALSCFLKLYRIVRAIGVQCARGLVHLGDLSRNQLISFGCA